MAVVPLLHAVGGAYPHAPIGTDSNPEDTTIGQPLLFGHGRDDHVAKSIETARRRDPDVSFAIFKERLHLIARQSVRLRKGIRLSFMRAYDAASRRDPQRAVAIAQESMRDHRFGDRWVRCRSSGKESPNPAGSGDQERAVAIFSKALNPVPFAGHRKERGWTGRPSPNAVCNAQPEHAPAIFVQPPHPV